jgi:hypothetical protein
MSNLMKIRPVGAELFHLDNRWTNNHAKANSRLSQFCERAYKHSVFNLYFRYHFTLLIENNVSTIKFLVTGM